MTGYYDRPVLKEPVWIWAVPAYFYCGGAAGAAAVLGAAAQLFGGEEMKGLVTRCRRLAAAGTAAGGALLIYDLGRPRRFLNMLRVFRPTSAMNLGSWVLAAAGTLTGVSAVGSNRPGILGASADAAGLAAGVAGLPLAGYTAVLLSDTAVPLWQSSRTALPWLFVSSAMSSAGSLLEPASLTPREHAAVSRFAMAGKAAEMAAIVAVERQASSCPGGKPLQEGPAGALWTASKALTAFSLAVSMLPGKPRRKRMVASGAATAGAVAMRFAIFHAGKASARDSSAAPGVTP